MKLYIKGIEIEPSTPWTFETIIEIYEQAYKNFKQNPTLETAKELECFTVKMELGDWIS